MKEVVGMDELTCMRCGQNWKLKCAVEEGCLACEAFREEQLCGSCYVIVAWEEFGKPEDVETFVDPLTGKDWAPKEEATV